MEQKSTVGTPNLIFYQLLDADKNLSLTAEHLIVKLKESPVKDIPLCDMLSYTLTKQEKFDPEKIIDNVLKYKSFNVMPTYDQPKTKLKIVGTFSYTATITDYTAIQFMDKSDEGYLYAFDYFCDNDDSQMYIVPYPSGCGWFMYKDFNFQNPSIHLIKHNKEMAFLICSQGFADRKLGCLSYTVLFGTIINEADLEFLYDLLEAAGLKEKQEPEDMSPFYTLW